jgi:hypothetical protein
LKSTFLARVPIRCKATFHRRIDLLYSPLSNAKA